MRGAQEESLRARGMRGGLCKTETGRGHRGIGRPVSQIKRSRKTYVPAIQIKTSLVASPRAARAGKGLLAPIRGKAKERKHVENNAHGYSFRDATDRKGPRPVVAEAQPQPYVPTHQGLAYG
jgi:hypothetical protein